MFGRRVRLQEHKSGGGGNYLYCFGPFLQFDVRSRSSSAVVQFNADVLGQNRLKCSVFDGFVKFFFCRLTESMCASTESSTSFTPGITLSTRLWFQRVKVSSRTEGC